MIKPEHIVPRGTLVAVGGNIDKSAQMEVLNTILSLPEGDTRVVEIIPTASNEPEETARVYTDAFRRIGAQHVGVMNIQERRQANDPDLVQRIIEADVVFLTGGDQLRLTNLLGGSDVLKALLGHYQRGGVIAGTSAGAVAMSQSMIYEGEERLGMRKGTVKVTAGLGLIRHAILDSHFTQRGRFKRLLEVVTGHPGMIGLGLDEDSGVVVKDGVRLLAIGSGVVVVVDGHEMRYSNITAVPLGEAIAEEGVLVHTLTRGHGYHLEERRYMRPEEVLAKDAVRPVADPGQDGGPKTPAPQADGPDADGAGA